VLIVGLTGGIGSGKSTVSDGFARRGIPVVDADQVAREVVATGEPALERIFVHFGTRIRHPDGSLNRGALRALIFNDTEQRRWLEQLLHPLIRMRILNLLSQLHGDYALLSSPLLLETDQHRLVDHVLVVDIPETLQIQRTMARDRNSEAQVRAILGAQLERSQRLAQADTVFDNRCSPTEIEVKIEALDTEFRHLARQLKKSQPAGNADH
jgi:dephospho-CoA kinase